MFVEQMNLIKQIYLNELIYHNFNFENKIQNYKYLLMKIKPIECLSKKLKKTNSHESQIIDKLNTFKSIKNLLNFEKSKISKNNSFKLNESNSQNQKN